MANGNGDDVTNRQSRFHVAESTGATVAIMLTLAFVISAIVGLFRPDTRVNAVDGQMLKELLSVVLGYVLGAASVTKGVDKGASAAAPTPTQPAPGTTMTTTVQTPPTTSP